MKIKDVMLNSRGTVALNNGYTLVNILYHKFSANTPGIILGCTICGPKGGDYIIGAFGFSHLALKMDLQVHCLDNICAIKSLRNGNTLESEVMLSVDEIIESGTSENACKIMAKAFNMKYITQDNIYSFLKKCTV